MDTLNHENLVYVVRQVLTTDWAMARRLYLVSKLFRQLTLRLTNGWPREDWVRPIYAPIEEELFRVFPALRGPERIYELSDLWMSLRPIRRVVPEIKSGDFPKRALLEACWCEGPVVVEMYPDHHLTLYPTDGVIWMGMLPTSFMIFHAFSIRSLDPKKSLKVVYHDHVRTQEIDILLDSDREPSRPYLVSAGCQIPTKEGKPRTNWFHIANGMVGWEESPATDEDETSVWVGGSAPLAEVAWLPTLLGNLFPGWAPSDY